MHDIIHSYKISTLVSQYVEGTRQWLYEIIDKWIDDATGGGGGGAVKEGGEEEKALRMFMLLAGPVRLPT